MSDTKDFDINKMITDNIQPPEKIKHFSYVRISMFIAGALILSVAAVFSFGYIEDPSVSNPLSLTALDETDRPMPHSLHSFENDIPVQPKPDKDLQNSADPQSFENDISVASKPECDSLVPMYQLPTFDAVFPSDVALKDDYPDIDEIVKNLRRELSGGKCGLICFDRENTACKLYVKICDGI